MDTFNIAKRTQQNNARALAHLLQTMKNMQASASVHDVTFVLDGGVEFHAFAVYVISLLQTNAGPILLLKISVRSVPDPCGARVAPVRSTMSSAMFDDAEIAAGFIPQPVVPLKRDVP